MVNAYSSSQTFNLIDNGDLANLKLAVENNPKVLEERNNRDQTPLEYAFYLKSSDKQLIKYLTEVDKNYLSVVDNIKGQKDINLDYSKIWPNDTNLLFFGEDHTEDETENQEILNMLPLLKEQGFTHLATEFQNSAIQSVIDSYQAGLVNIDALTNNKRGFFKIDSFDLSTIKKATELGIKVIALDISKMATRSQDDIDTRSYEGMNLRNDHWMKLIKAIFNKNPKAKIVVHCGRTHSGYRFFIRTNQDVKTMKWAPSLLERFKKESNVRAYSVWLSRPDRPNMFSYATAEAVGTNKKFVIKPKNEYERVYVYRQDAILNMIVIETKKDANPNILGVKEKESSIGQKDCSSFPCVKE